ncbi:hypothetical protein AMTRI_Chr13g90120 [Amborella trichopoda]
MTDMVEKIVDSRVTWEGCSVILDINNGDRIVFARLNPSSTLKIGKKVCSRSPLIGCPFGSLFQLECGVNGPYLSRVSRSLTGASKSEDQNDCKTKDNRALVDSNTAQTLSGDDIDVMRREGATGEQIIEALIANSSTFQTKTAFSQEKYILRKQKKYAPTVLLRRPFTRSICEAYFKKLPARIGFLRMDTLSLLLSMANVSISLDVLVVDMVGGILTGAVAERLGGTGYVCNTHLGTKQYPMDIVGIFNFDKAISSRIVRSSLSDLHLAKKSSEAHISNENLHSMKLLGNDGHSLESSNGPISIVKESLVQEENSSHQCSSTILSSESEQSTSMDLDTCFKKCSNSVDENKDPSSLKVSKSLKPGRQASEEEIKLWKENGFTSLIVAAPELDPWNAIQELLPLLSYSAPFAIYHHYLQPLAICMHNLQVKQMAIGLQISEPWLREYQVLPSRTHPQMQMNSFGGYILSGTRVFNSESEQGST